MNTPFELLLPCLLPLLPFALQGDESEDDDPVVSQDDPVVSQAQLEAWTEEIKVEIEELRDARFPRPVSVAVSSSADLKEYMKGRIEKNTTPGRLEADEMVAKLLGLIPAEMDYMGTLEEILDSQVGGFYDPETEGFYLMDRFGGDLARTILAHELTHALDDQLYDIDGTIDGLDGNSDAEFAYHAVVEGSGTAIMNAWTMQHLAELDMAEVMAAASMGQEELAEAPPYMWKPLIAIYLHGAAFLNRTESVMVGSMQTPELDDIHRAFDSPPLSSEQILHPEKFWEAEHWDGPIAVELDTESLPPGWSVVHENTLGEFMWGLVLQPLDQRGGLGGAMELITSSYTYPSSAGWGGDRFLYLAKGEGRALLCETVWDSRRDQEQFAKGMRGFVDHLTAAASATATAKGVEGSGFRLVAGKGEESERVWIEIRSGLSREELAELTDAIGFGPAGG